MDIDQACIRSDHEFGSASLVLSRGMDQIPVRYYKYLGEGYPKIFQPKQTVSGYFFNILKKCMLTSDFEEIKSFSNFWLLDDCVIDL